jgi:polyisoprenoid-binding protein YceI
MHRSLFLLFAMAFVASTASAQTSTWVPDKAHSEVDFSILHMSLSRVHGRFGNIGGSIILNEADVSKSTVNVNIDVNSVDTGVSSRDNDLKGSDLFDTAQYPTATYVSTGVAKTADGFTVTGNLTLRGVTKPVVMQVEGPDGPVSGLDHKPHAGYSASATVSRTAFGIGAKYPAAMLGDEVKLTIELDVVKQ